MPLDLKVLDAAPRLLIEAELVPVQGTRFQPTGFPNLGAARYDAPDGSGENLLVESAQSMANRLEAVCWDTGRDDWVEGLAGLPYVRVVDGGGPLTTSIQEAHRLNSPYIEETDWFPTLKAAIGYDERAKRPIDFRGKVFPAILKYDPNSLIHGFFLESIAGLIRSPRMLSAFIEAEGVKIAGSGGVKNDRVSPNAAEMGGAAKGYGNVPFARDEYVARRIVAYFNLDLAQVRGFGLGAEAEKLLVTLSLYKIAALLEGGLRLRTACDFDLAGPPKVTRPAGFILPSRAALAKELPELIAALAKAGRFADSPVTTATRTAKKS